MKKNKVLTTIFACIPGAGQMYMGQMKLGTSTMFIFSLIYYLYSKISIDIFSFLLPVIWFFSFFDTLNKNSGAVSEPDHFIFANEAKSMTSRTLRLIIAFLLIYIGSIIIIPFVANTFSNVLPWQVTNFLYNLVGNSAKVFIGIFVLYIGCSLIGNKK